MNRKNRLLDDYLAAQGEVDSVRPPLRNIVARALQVNASGLIAGHNHPSGAAEASESDRLLSRDLIAAGRPLGLRLLDHVIVGGETTYSFADSGLLDELELECLAPEPTAPVAVVVPAQLHPLKSISAPDVFSWSEPTHKRLCLEDAA